MNYVFHSERFPRVKWISTFHLSYPNHEYLSMAPHSFRAERHRWYSHEDTRVAKILRLSSPSLNVTSVSNVSHFSMKYFYHLWKLDMTRPSRDFWSIKFIPLRPGTTYWSLDFECKPILILLNHSFLYFLFRLSIYIIDFFFIIHFIAIKQQWLKTWISSQWT